jgi:hypothetical protein
VSSTRFLSTKELEQLRADQEDYMPDTYNILRGTAAVNSIGEPALTWGTVAGTVHGRLRPTGWQAGIVTAGGQIQTDEKWYLYIAQAGTLLPGDRAVGISTAGTFEIVQSWEEESWPTAIRAEVRRLEA